MSTGRKFFGWYGVLTFLLVVAAATSVQVAAANLEPGEEVTYTLTEKALEGPGTLEAGYHAFTLQNDADTEVDVVIVKLGEGDTGADLIKEVQAIDKAFMSESGDPSAAFRAALEGRTLWGGAEAGAGETASVGVGLPAGQYLLLGNLYGEAEGAPNTYVTKPLEVTGKATAAPQADVTVQMVDFAFAFPADLKPGKQIWKFVNHGEQVHVAAIMKLKPDKTMDDVMRYAESFKGEDPTEEFAYVGMLSKGVSNYLDVNPTPGTYVAVCWVPDYAVGGDGQPHMAHGMMQSFTVAAN